MKPQTRPFMVEVKSRRRPLQASHANRSPVIDEPSPDDLPSRDVRGDVADTPFAAASRVFSALATSAISSASGLGDLAVSAFTPKPQEPPADNASLPEDRIGRILPSLLPVNPFENASAEEGGPVQKKARAERRRKAAGEVVKQQEASEPSEVGPHPLSQHTIVPELSVAAERASLRNRKPSRGRADARVRPGEGWRRRRLPKACW